jgi:hypothetical protein
MTGVSMGEFVIAYPGCAAPLDPSQSCTVGIQFKPHSPGPKTAQVTVTVGRYPDQPMSSALTGMAE